MPGENFKTRNPYIIGRPIHEQDRFFGRETLFAFIEDNLYNNIQVILLHGQRRIGKSSVLKQIPNFIQLRKFVFIQFDLQDRAHNDLASILHDLSKAIVDQTNISPNQVQIPSLDELKFNHGSAFSRRFLPQFFQSIDNRNLVLLLDEFDVIGNDNVNTTHNSHFFSYLQKILTYEKQLFVIPVIGKYLYDLPNLRNLFKGAPFKEIGLLDDIGAINLIKTPVQDKIIYKDETIEEILKLSAGHPYFTQAICWALFNQARNNNNRIIHRDDVQQILDLAIENAEGALTGIWDILTIPERVILSAIAEAAATEAGFEKYTTEQLFAFLNRNGVVETEYLSKAADKLSKNVCFYDRGFNLRAKLTQHWLLQNHKLRDEIQELEKVEESDINHLKEVAESRRKRGNHGEVIQLYQQALTINPNNFAIVSILAKDYLQTNDFTKACELARRFYQSDPIHHKKEYLEALSVYGHDLIYHRKFTLAKQQYQKILEIDPNRKSAIERLEEIKIYENFYFSGKSPLPTQQTLSRRGSKLNLILLSIATILALGTLTVFSPNKFSLCSKAEQKEWLFFCTADKTIISNGDRTIFPTIINPSRDEGIKAFKQDKYQDAIKLFEKAVAANRNDPEVLIYYNNARARESGEPLSLAVAVPALQGNKNKLNVAKEILRGVAQSQHQFNDGGGLNGRLLEIAIANDAGDPKQAKEIATELIKNKSILGIVGHHSSESTKAALEEYNKTDIPVISPTSTSTFLEGNNFFRGLPSDTISAEELADYAFNDLNIKKVAIFYNDSPFSNSMREEFTKIFEKLGGEIVRRILINQTSLDAEYAAYQKVTRSVLKYQADAALLCPDSQHINNALKIARVNKELLDINQNKKVFKRLLGCDTLYGSDILSQGDDAIEGLITVVPWFRETSKARNFAEKAYKQWGGNVSWRTATSFDATQAFLQALSSNPTRFDVSKRLKDVNIPENDTSGDVFQFNPERERKTEPILVYVEKKKFVSIR